MFLICFTNLVKKRWSEKNREKFAGSHLEFFYVHRVLIFKSELCGTCRVCFLEILAYVRRFRFKLTFSALIQVRIH